MEKRGKIRLLGRMKKLGDLFPSQKAYSAFIRFAIEMKGSSNCVTVHHASQFATKLASEKIYNKANFYWYVITPLVDLGFLDKIPTWNNQLKKTQYCYVPLKFEIPRHPVGHGYYRDSWHICKEWNELFFGNSINTLFETAVIPAYQITK